MSEGAQRKLFLREWREFHSISQTDLAKKIGVTKGEISRLEGGQRRMTMGWLSRISEALELRPEQLMTPPPVYRNVSERANDVSRRPSLSFLIAPLPTSDIIEIEGDEMGDTLRPGEAVVIDKTRTVPSPAGIFAVRQQGSTVLRRIQASLSGDEVIVSCDNRAYNPITVKRDAVEIIGRVVTKLSRM